MGNEHKSERAGQQAVTVAIKNGLESIVDWVGDLLGRRSSETALLPLTPKYDPKRHAGYFNKIEAALANPDVRNVALTGGYGVGKSSILDELVRRHKRKVISISLSTLGFAPDDQLTNDHNRKLSKTNQIQKEIVKQLLYSQDPERMPGSRYRRMTRFRPIRELAFAAVISVPVTVAFLLTGWAAKLWVALPLPAWLEPYGSLMVFILTGLFVMTVRLVFHNRIHIEKVSAGAATISLSPATATYFDEYLDEIVYFFEMTRRDIVIFEDIDRFDDAHIFETLRSLNTILNGAKQLGRRNIRFVYAIKDSIFDELGRRAADEELSETAGETAKNVAKKADAAGAEVARANRTKFFDLVIPVVPFITHRSARDLLVQVMSDVDHHVSSDLIDLTARHVADMRLLKNIRNEFVVFKQQVLDSGTLELSEDQLFAMMLYKSTHLSDFEMIRFGSSDLDALYDDSLSLVSQNLRRIELEIRRRRRELRSTEVLEGRGQILGTSFVNYLDRVMRHFGQSRQAYTYNGEAKSHDDLMSDEFWEGMAASDAPFQFRFWDRYGHSIPGSVSRADLPQIVGDPLTAQSWRDAQRKEVVASIAELTADKNCLVHADIQKLITRPEFLLQRNGSEESMQSLASKRLKSELAIGLVRDGYIDRNFTLYTSTFYGERVSANAMNFMLKHVERNQIGMHFVLSAGDVRTIIKEKGRSVLSEKAAYNVSILDYLLAEDGDGARVLVAELVQYQDDERELLLAYMEEGKCRGGLIELLASRWSRTLIFVISDAAVDEALALTLVDAAIKAKADDVDYKLDDSVGKYLLAHYGQLNSFRADDTSTAVASTAATLVDKAGIDLPSLEPLGTSALAAVIAARRFAVTRANLVRALGSNHSLSLDAVAESNRDVYQRVLEDLPAYLSALDTTEYTITDATRFFEIAEDVIEADDSHLDAIVARSAQDCIAVNITAVSAMAWRTLARHRRFPVTFANVRDYLAELGLDADLASMLQEAGRIEQMDGVEEGAKHGLALRIINGRDQLPDSELRSKLAQCLSMQNYIPASEVRGESGRLVGYLIEKGVISDDAEAFGLIPVDDLSGREFAIAHSKSFSSYMTPIEVPASQVGRLLRSGTVPNDVKRRIVSEFETFTSDAPRSELEYAASYVVGMGATIGFDQVARLAEERVSADLVIALLEPHLSSLSLATLTPILVALGGDYALLTQPNGKRPLLPLQDSVRALAEHLKMLGTVSSYDERKGNLRVNMRRT